QRSHEVAELRSEHALERPLAPRDHADLDIAGAQRRSGLEPDEASADHDRALDLLGAIDDSARIGKRAQVEHALGTRQVEPVRHGADGENERVVGELASIREYQLLVLRIERNGADAGRKVDTL